MRQYESHPATSQVLGQPSRLRVFLRRQRGRPVLFASAPPPEVPALGGDQFGDDPFPGDVFAFFARAKDRIKLVVWNRNEFWLHCKRSEKGTFPFAVSGEGRLEIEQGWLAMILEGIEWKGENRPLVGEAALPSVARPPLQAPWQRSSMDVMSTKPARALTLTLLPGAYAVCRLPAGSVIPEWALGGRFASVTRTPTELSIVCPEESVPEGVPGEKGWGCLKIEGPVAFSEVGVMASIADPLAAAGISLFVISTFETDYVLVKANNLERAAWVLAAAGHRVRTAEA